MNLAISHIDATIVLVYVLACVVFGMWIGRGQQGMGDYLLGGRSLPWWAILGSIVATETSTVTFLSVPGMTFQDGGNFNFLQLSLGYILGRGIIVALLLPAYFEGSLYTAYQVLDRRFGGSVKQSASALFLVTRNLADGLRLYLTAVVLMKVLGLPLAECVLLMGVATILYTVTGGMKAVVWNDCIQFCVYIFGAVLACGIIVNRLPGGWDHLMAFGTEHQKWQVFDVSFALNKPYTLWAGIVGGVFVSLGTHGTDQLMVQRYLSARSRRDAGKALLLSGLVVLAQFALFLLIGVALACFYEVYPPAVPFGAADNDKVFPTFIVNELPVGVVGITLAAVFSAAMSTLSSSLSSSTSAALNDFYVPLRGNTAGERELLWVGRGMTVAFGAVQMVVGIVGAQDNVVSSVLAIASFTAGVILGVFFLGTWSRRADRRSATVGLLTGLAAITCIAFKTELAWPWWALVGSVITFAVGVACSYLLPHRDTPAET